MYFVYALADPCTDEIAYVGITNNVRRRFHQHLNYQGMNGKKDEWIQKLHDEKLIPSLKVLETVESLKIARQREAYWI